MAKRSSKAKSAPWGVRIVGHSRQKAGEFLANPANWRTHGLAQEAQLTSVLNDVGFVQSVIVNKRTDAAWGRDRNVETLVDGHLRVKAALARGEDTEVPVSFVDLTPDEERLVLLTLDPIGTMAGRDDELLQGLRTQVEVEWPEIDLDLDALLKTPKKRAKGVSHTVHSCRCCGDGCGDPQCGCYREAE